MPNPGGRDAKVWDGTPATLKDHLRWFEHEAADCAVHPSDMINIFLEYVDSRKVEALEGYKANSWEDFKRQLEDNYRSRLDHRLADADDFNAFSARWSIRKLVLLEDLIGRKEELQLLTKRSIVKGWATLPQSPWLTNTPSSRLSQSSAKIYSSRSFVAGWYTQRTTILP